ncbi:PEFG-CTERM sorting domain-containing protein [Marine Group I thaumarchaeote]|uniref:PEFG-CTERM sorting domain-containing protein n=1 Tax=Marine Group I thaumarchaeote TaxID=2511932 RepID=A0A7K4MQ71_9ARCH|nr:PEFG-CTERM sorting domain-containing protein [Marine Group I thaumarchaeote]
MNSRRYAMTSLSIVFLAVTIMSVSALGQNAYAAGAGMSLSAEGSGSTFDISGTSDRSDLDVTIVLKSGNGIHDVAQLSVSDGSYSTTFNVSNLKDGTYTIAANQGSSSKYNLSVSVDVSDGTSTSSVSVSNQAAAAEEEAGSVEAVEVAASGLSLTAGGVEGSTTIDVSGTTDRTGDITLKVTAPNGNVVSVSQISPSGGSFMTTIETGGPLWSQDGMYTISAHQGAASNYQTSAEIEIADGHVIPEFGVIAAMILAVAIVSIIVVTAKTKLSIVPRY